MSALLRRQALAFQHYLEFLKEDFFCVLGKIR